MPNQLTIAQQETDFAEKGHCISRWVIAAWAWDNYVKSVEPSGFHQQILLNSFLTKFNNWRTRSKNTEPIDILKLDY